MPANGCVGKWPTRVGAIGECSNHSDTVLTLMNKNIKWFKTVSCIPGIIEHKSFAVLFTRAPEEMGFTSKPAEAALGFEFGMWFLHNQSHHAVPEGCHSQKVTGYIMLCGKKNDGQSSIVK